MVKLLEYNNIPEGLVPFLHSDSAGIRALTAQTLGQLQADSALEILVDLIQDTDIDVALAAVQALGEIGDTDAITNLWQAYCTQPGGEIKLAVVQALGHIGGSEVFGYLCQCIKSPGENVYWGDDPDDYSYWMEIQFQAIKSLRALITEDTFSADGFFTTDGSFFDDDTLSAEGSNPAENIIEVIVNAINNPDFQDLSVPGITILTAMGQQGVNAVSLFLCHPQAIIKRRAINALTKHSEFSELMGRSQKCRSRFECLLQDSDTSVVAATASALADIGWLARLQSVQIKDTQKWDRLSNGIQLALIQEFSKRDNTFIQTLLLEKVNKSDVTVKIAALKKLKEISCPDLLQYFFEVITGSVHDQTKNKDDEYFVNQILEALGKTTSPLRDTAIKSLCHVLKKEKYSLVHRSIALESIKKICKNDDLNVQKTLTDIIASKSASECNLRRLSLISLCCINPQRGAESIGCILEKCLNSELKKTYDYFAKSSETGNNTFTLKKTTFPSNTSNSSPLAALLHYYAPRDNANSTQLNVDTSLSLNQCEQEHLLKAEQRQVRNMNLVNPKSLSHETEMVITAISQLAYIKKGITLSEFHEQCEAQLISLLAHSDTRIRIAAMQILAKHESKKAVVFLLPFLADSSKSVIIHAARTLALIDADHLLVYGDILLLSDSVNVLQIICDAIVRQQKTYFTSRLYERLSVLMNHSLHVPIIKALLALAGREFFSRIIETALSGNDKNSVIIAGLLKVYVPNLAIEKLLKDLSNETPERQYLIIKMLAVLGKTTTEEV